MGDWVTHRGYSIEVHPCDGFTVWSDVFAPRGWSRFIDYTFDEAIDLVEAMREEVTA